MSSGRNYGDPETRRRILEAALHLAGEMGPSMRIADVARSAGVSHQAIYLHFGGREGLLLALLSFMEEAFGLEERYRRVASARSGTEALARLVEWLSALNERLDQVGWVLEEAQYLDEAFGRDWRGRNRALRELRRQVIERLAGEGLLSPAFTVERATDLFLALTTLGTWQDLTRNHGWSPRTYVNRVTGWLTEALVVSRVGSDSGRMNRSPPA